MEAPASMLFARRKRLEALAKAEAAGESFWTEQFDEKARIKLVHAFNDAFNNNVRDEYASVARKLVLRDEGLTYLSRSDLTDAGDIRVSLRKGNEELILSIIEAIAIVHAIPAGWFV